MPGHHEADAADDTHAGQHLGTEDASKSIARVEVEQVAKTFGAIPALRGVSARFRAGTATVLAGPNGAGKSTLLALLGTQLRPQRGRVRHLTENSQRLNRQEVRARLGWVSHTSHCYGQLSGRRNIELMAELHGMEVRQYDEVAERLGLGKFADRPVATLSRGQRQRIALGRALVSRPSLLLLDEPWTGLDRASSALLDRIVREETERGALVIVVSHDESTAERLGASRLELVRGRVTPSALEIA